MESFLGAVCVLAVIRFYYKISLVSDDLAVDYFFALYPFQQASISLHDKEGRSSRGGRGGWGY